MLFLKTAGLPQMKVLTIGYMWLAKAGKQAARTPEEKVKVKVTQDVALQ